MAKPKALIYGNDSDLTFDYVSINSSSNHYIKKMLEANGIETDLVTHREVPANIMDYGFVAFRGDPPIREEELAYMNAVPLEGIVHLNNPRVLAANNFKQYHNDPLLRDYFPAGTQYVDAPVTLPRGQVAQTLTEKVLGTMHDLQGAVVLKPGNGHGGKGVVSFQPGVSYTDLNKSIMDYVAEHPSGGYIVQEFDKEIAKNGDYRVIMINGEPVTAFRRIPAEGDFRANMSAGGTIEVASELPQDIYDIAIQTKPYLLKNQLYLVGADVAHGNNGAKLLELNMQSPGGLNVSDIKGNNYKAQIGFLDMVHDRLGLAKPKEYKLVPWVEEKLTYGRTG